MFLLLLYWKEKHEKSMGTCSQPTTPVGWQLYQMTVVLGGSCPSGRCPGGSCPGGSCPGGSCPVVVVRVAVVRIHLTNILFWMQHFELFQARCYRF